MSNGLTIYDTGYNGPRLNDDPRKRQAYADRYGFFWLLCPLCKEPFGGHEWGNSRWNSIPAGKGNGLRSGVCPWCEYDLWRSDPGCETVICSGSVVTSRLTEQEVYQGRSQRIAHTLYINRNDSRCGKCGKGASYDESSHQRVLGWSKEERAKPGCGVRWEYVSSDYFGMKKIVSEIRPDLIWWSELGEYQ